MRFHAGPMGYYARAARDGLVRSSTGVRLLRRSARDSGYYGEAPEYGYYAEPPEMAGYGEAPEYGYYAEPPEMGCYAEPPE